MKLTDAELRVAKAICKSRTCEGMNCCQWPANLGRVQCPVKAGRYDDAARAAIAELRSPEPAREDDTWEKRLRGQIEGIETWLRDNAPGVGEEQKHLDEGSIERVYWHYGYLIALRDCERNIYGKKKAN